MAVKDDIGFVAEDVGFTPATHKEVGFTLAPQDTTPDINPLEVQLQQQKDKEAQAKAQAQAQAQAAAQAAADPKNWTYKQTQEHFKQNPPKDPIGEAQAQALLDQKKKQRDMTAYSIQNAPPPSFKQVIGDFVNTFWTGDTPETKGIKADRAYVMSKMFDVPLDVINKNYEAFARKASIDGQEGQMGAKKVLGAMVVPPITAALVANPVGAALGAAGFQAFAEGENQLISNLKGEKYQFLRGLSTKDLLPAESSDATKSMVDMAETIGQFAVGAGIFHAGMSQADQLATRIPALERFTKDLASHYDLPKEMYLPTVSGADVKVPIEKVVSLTQGPNWDDVKGELQASPTPKEEIKVKEETHEQAMTDQSKKDLNFMSEEEKATVQNVVNSPEEKSLDEHTPDEILNLPDVVAARDQASQIDNTESINTPDRQVLRTKIVDEAYGSGAENKNKRADIVLGGPAAGKGQIVDPLLKQHGSLLIDSDVYKTKLPEYNNGVGAAAVHGESSHIIEDQVFEKAIKNGDNIVLPRLGKNSDTINAIIDRLNLNGYDVHVHHVKLPVEKAMGRSVERFRKTGRFVDPQYVKEVGLTPSKTYGMVKALKGVKSYAEYSTDVPRGQRPIVTETSNGQPAAFEDVSSGGSLGQDSSSKGPGEEQGSTGSSGDQGSLKERKFITSVRNADKTAPEVSSQIEGQYQPISNEQTLAEAKDLLARDPEGVQAAVEGPDKPTRVTNAAAQLLIDKAQNEGRFEDAIRLVEKTAQKNTSMGQAVQALSMYSRLSPEGILRFASKQLRVAGVKITPEFGEKIYQRAKKLQDMPEGRPKQIETALILKDIATQVPANALKKISMVQTMSQLLNLKTIGRNLLGNVVFMGAENMADTMGTALDVGTSLLTGKRTQYLPSLITQLKGLKQGLSEGTQEALLGIDLKKTNSKFDLPRNGVFNEGVMGALEKTLSITLGATDRAFYQAAFNDSLRMSLKGSGLTEATPEMIEKAHHKGLYKTFQDDNVIRKVFVGLKKGLNAGKDWGVGDMVIKYPGTPASILDHGIEYSPFGFIKTMLDVSKPLFGKPFNQTEFIHNTSRALTGSVLLVGAGAILAKLGIISGKREKDKDVVNTQKQVGIQEYQFNADAMKRFVASGFDHTQAKIQPGDNLFTYDWMQPASIGLALGANMIIAKDHSLTDKVVNMADRLFEASETLASQPLVQGLKVITGKQSISEGVAATIQGIPASFVPTLLNQIRQLTDNTARNTKDPNYYKTMENMVLNKIPGLENKLPARMTALGKTQEMYQLGTNNPFNVFLNPTFASKYNPDPVSEMVLGIWDRSGQTVQFPRVASAKIKVGPDQIEMSPETYNAFQSYIGTKTNKLFTLLANNKPFMALPDDYKAKKLQGMLTDINTAAKIELLGYRPKKEPSDDVITIIKAISSDKKKIDQNFSEEDLGFSRTLKK